jgi:lysophospholipase L1-like esterase
MRVTQADSEPTSNTVARAGSIALGALIGALLAASAVAAPAQTPAQTSAQASVATSARDPLPGLPPAEKAVASLPAPVPSISAAAPLAETPDVVLQRWQASFDAFSAADRAHPPQPGGVLFVGSSSIRLWDGLETEFSALPIVVKRGFGGSSMADCTAAWRRLVVPYQPRLIIVYAGDNDLAQGRTPQEVFSSFRGFVDRVRRALPQTRIAYLSIKPSPLREALLPAIRTTNAMIERYTAGVANLDYIDIFTPMLGANGRPRAELFRADHLHLNAEGYALWKSIVASHVQ